MNNIIHLKDYSDIYNKPSDAYRFVKAYATNSRLMGVVGVRLHYEGVKPLVLFFHLDFEEYGFDRFEAYESNDTETIDRVTQSFMGGLGAKLVKIDLDQASSLIYTAAEVGASYYYDVPLDFFEYEYLIHDFCEPIDQRLCDKICTPIKNDYACINYFLMRTAGLDYGIRDFKFTDKALEFHFCDEPTVLLKNEIIEEGDSYVCKSIIDYYDSYKLYVTRIMMSEHKITSCIPLNELVLSSKEASFQLNKKEFILVCYAEHVDRFKMVFEKLNPAVLKNIYEGGTLYTAFNPHNHHVNQKTYYLNGDVYATYYVTEEHQIVISCFDQKLIKSIRTELKEQYEGVDVLADLEAENPILYNFVISGSQDFFDFLGV